MADRKDNRNYLEGGFRLDRNNIGKLWTWIRGNKKFLTLITLFSFNLVSGISVRDIAVVSRTDVQTLKNTVQKQGEIINSLTQQSNATQEQLKELKGIVNDDTTVLERQAQRERDKRHKRELEEYNRLRAEKLKKISQADDLHASPTLPTPDNYPVFRGAKND